MASIIGGIAGFWINGVPAVAGAISTRRAATPAPPRWRRRAASLAFTATANPARIELDIFDRGDPTRRSSTTSPAAPSPSRPRAARSSP